MAGRGTANGAMAGVVAVLALAVACSTSAGSADGQEDAGSLLPLPTTLAGGVSVIETWRLDGSAVISTVSAVFTDGAPPTSLVVAATEGECTLYLGSTREDCSATVEDDEVENCGHGCRDGRCIEYPAPLDAGTIVVRGLATDVTLTTGGTGAWYAATDYDDHAPVLRAGTKVRATATGGLVPAFDLAIRGVPRFDGTIDLCRAPFGSQPGVVCLHDGQDVVLRWTPSPENPPGGRVFLRLSSGWHGSPGLVLVWCDSPDDGEIRVPAGLLADYPSVSGGINEYSSAGRMTAVVADLPRGPIALKAMSQFQFLVTRDNPPPL